MTEEKDSSKESKEAQQEPSVISDEAMSNIKDSSTWIDALLVIVCLLYTSPSPRD